MLIYYTEIHIKNEDTFPFLKLTASEKTADYKLPANTHAAVSPYQPGDQRIDTKGGAGESFKS